MQQRSYPFEKLPFSRLFKTYTSNFRALEEFYEYDPFDSGAVADRAGEAAPPEPHSRLENMLERFNADFDLSDATERNIRRLGGEGALAVVTGQQLSLFGGPLYTVFKTISAIHLSRILEKQLGRPVIPVFWLADEDHDYEEVRHCGVFNGDSLQRLSLPPEAGDRPVAEKSLPDELEEVREEAEEVLYETDFTGDLFSLIDGTYREGGTFGQAFGDFLMSLFGEHGLVLMGSNREFIKEGVSGEMARSIEEAGALRRALEKQSEGLEENFHRQVTLYDSNLFYRDEQGKRVKISRQGARWTAGGEEWSGGELAEAIRGNPGRFSPNVFMRPIIQDRLLPTLGYVAGPGEIAYYGQMKEMYRCFGMRMPVVFPRLSATLIEPSIERVMDELPFELQEYARRIEDLESAYVERSESVDIEEIFAGWKEEVEAVSESRKERISRIDPTLDGAAGKATSVYFGELDKLKGKVYRSVKQQEQTQLNRIRKIKAQLFPGDGMQEREVAAIYFMNKYGTELWDRLLESLEEDEEFRSHKLIYL